MTAYKRLGLPEGLALIVGLGSTGLSVARFLAREGVEFAVIDSRENPPGLQDLRREFPSAATHCGGFDATVFARAASLIVSPGVSVKEPVIVQQSLRGTPVLGDIELFARVVKAPVIGITGSNGKSTVTTLVGEMAKAAGRHVAVGGNLGTPALDLLADEQVEIFVLELSSFQLETTSSLPLSAAVILNISEDHMDRYALLHDYIEAKFRIFQHTNTAVMNADDVEVMALLPRISTATRLVQFTLDEPDVGVFGVREITGRPYLCKGTEVLLAVADVRIQGWHNVANALASLALGEACGLPMSAMLETLKEFPGLPHRTQWVAESKGVTWYNDSKATNVGAALAAINGVMAEKLILIAGGQGKGQDFTPLREPLRQRARQVVLLGEDAEKIARALTHEVPQRRVKDMREAVLAADEIAQTGDAVLLSPACASFDMFKGYAHRGEVFSQLVRELVQ